MKYDTIIIGGGLSGLVAGISLAAAGNKAAIVSTGQSALHFSTGSLGLYGTDAAGNSVEHPLEAIASLPAAHPYSRIGAARVAGLAAAVPGFFSEAGISLKGSCDANHYRLTPLGLCRPCWLSMDDFFTCPDPGQPGYKSCLIVNFKGFLDFYPGYLADGLKSHGIAAKSVTIELEAVERLRHSVAEMRAASLGRVLTGAAIEKFADEINRHAGGCDAAIIPAVVGIDSDAPLRQLRSLARVPIYCVPTTPMSVCGLRMQNLLRRHFERLGGTYLLGDNAIAAHMGGDGRLESVETAALGADLLEADNFILATGGIFSRGIVAEPHRVFEPLIGVDVDAPTDRDQWYDDDFFASQPYMSYGVSTDADFHPLSGGRPVPNLYAAGAVLGGYDALREGSGAGVAILTAMHAASLILNNQK